MYQRLLASGLIVFAIFAVFSGVYAWESARLTSAHPPAADPPAATDTPEQIFHRRQEALPKTRACATIALDDPVAEARRNMSRGDYRVFTVFGFTPGDAPGLLCTGEGVGIVSRGGTFVSDMPDACGAFSHSNADPAKMRAYNEELGRNALFRKMTGCRTADYCETTYGKQGDPRGRDARPDPRCPNEPAILIAMAANTEPAVLDAAIGGYDPKEPGFRDTLTQALIATCSRAQWANARLLVARGADVDGIVTDPERRRFQSSPLNEVFNQNDDKAGQLPMARWLFAHGATVEKSQGHVALKWAAYSGNEAAVDFLLARGASPNGSIGARDLKHLTEGSIQSAGGGYGYGDTAFYAAIDHAQTLRAEQTPSEKAWADDERRSGERIAVKLYKAGGLFFVGKVYDDLRDNPSTNIASILVAAAGRQGRADELIDRILEGVARNPADRPKQQAGIDRLRAYLIAVKSCTRRTRVPRDVSIKLCAYGDV